jgi:hypothetical protein
MLLGGGARAPVPGDGFGEQERAEEEDDGFDAAVVSETGGIWLSRVSTYFPQGIAILTVVLLPRRRLLSRIRMVLEHVRCKVLDKAERKGGS